MTPKKQRLESLPKSASDKFFLAAEKSLDMINSFLDLPPVARQNMTLEIKVCNNVLQSLGRILQHESGREVAILGVGRAISRDQEEMREFIEKNLPHLMPPKKRLAEKTEEK